MKSVLNINGQSPYLKQDKDIHVPKSSNANLKLDTFNCKTKNQVSFKAMAADDILMMLSLGKKAYNSLGILGNIKVFDRFEKTFYFKKMHHYQPDDYAHSIIALSKVPMGEEKGHFPGDKNRWEVIRNNALDYFYKLDKNNILHQNAEKLLLERILIGRKVGTFDLCDPLDNKMVDNAVSKFNGLNEDIFGKFKSETITKLYSQIQWTYGTPDYGFYFNFLSKVDGYSEEKAKVLNEWLRDTPISGEIIEKKAMRNMGNAYNIKSRIQHNLFELSISEKSDDNVRKLARKAEDQVGKIDVSNSDIDYCIDHSPIY